MKTILSVTVIVAALVTGACMFISNSFPKVAYVELNQVYSDFQLKKELETKLDNVKQKRKEILDSLEVELNAISKRIEASAGKNMDEIKAFEFTRQNYMQQHESFEQDNLNMTQQYSGQIWKQLNQYVQDYGKEHGYDYILGADGNGTVMYADQGKNITEEIKKYVNEKYKGSL